MQCIYTRAITKVQLQMVVVRLQKTIQLSDQLARVYEPRDVYEM